MKKVSLEKMFDPKLHKSNLFEPETEELTLLLRYLEGIPAWFFFHIWKTFENDSELEKQLYEICGKNRLVDYLNLIHQKNSYKSGKRMISKSFTLAFNTKRIFELYPDAKILFILRDPKSAVPSTISFLLKGQNRIHNLDTAPESKKREFYNKVYKTTLAYFKLADKLIRSNNNNNLMLITQEQLLSDFKNTFIKSLNFYNIEITPHLQSAIEQQDEKQKDFKSGHKYSLEQFGFTEKQFEEDFKFIYDNYPV